MKNSRQLSVLNEKLNSMPHCPLKTYSRAALEAGKRLDLINPEFQRSRELQSKISKAFEIIEKIVDQYIFLDHENFINAYTASALEEAEEATCDAVRFLIRAFE